MAQHPLMDVATIQHKNAQLTGKGLAKLSDYLVCIILPQLHQGIAAKYK